jgi:hypothetical protein
VEEEKAEHAQLLNTVSETLIGMATGRRILFLLAVFTVYRVAVMGPAYRRIQTFSGGVGAIGFLIVYRPEKAYQMLAAYGPQGRQYYATIALTLDTIFSLASALVFSLILTYLFHRAFSREGVLQRALLVPPAAMVADLLENVNIIAMLLTYPQKLPAIALLASAFSTVKWTAISAELVLVVVGLAGWLIQKGLSGDARAQ